MKKKVLVWETLSTVAGGQKMTLSIIDMLVDNYDFHCLIPGKGMLSDELEKRNILYSVIGNQDMSHGVKGKFEILKYGLISLKSIVRSIKAIRKFKPDFLYAPGPAALPWSAICGMLTNKKVIWHLHHVFLDGPTKKLLNFFSGWKSVEKIIAVSKCVSDQITNTKACGKKVVVYNPVDVEKYANGNCEKVAEELKESYGIDIEAFGKNDKTIVVGQFALIQRMKKQDFVIDVIYKLEQKGYNVIGLFAGESRENDYYDEIKEKISGLNYHSNIIFLGRRNDVEDLFKCIDCVVIPSSFEGFPLVGVEAASAGIPVVACDVAGAKEFIEVSGNGELFEFGCVSSAAQSIINVIDNKEKYRVNTKSFVDLCTFDKYKEKIIKEFKAIC